MSRLKKCITDITEIKAKDGKLYTSVIFDCFDLSVLGIAMSTNMKAELCVQTLDNTMASYPALRGTILHSDRGAQYTSDLYRKAIIRYGICQSMNSAGGHCHDNARCESIWARMKTELLYDRYDPEQLTVEQLKSLVWRYFMSYWNNRRIFSANGGLPPISQYTSQAYFNLTKEYGITPSMSRRGNCYDNALAENFFGILKAECICRHKPETFEEANKMIDDYIYFYNHTA